MTPAQHADQAETLAASAQAAIEGDTGPSVLSAQQLLLAQVHIELAQFQISDQGTRRGVGVALIAPEAGAR